MMMWHFDNDVDFTHKELIVLLIIIIVKIEFIWSKIKIKNLLVKINKKN